MRSFSIALAVSLIAGIAGLSGFSGISESSGLSGLSGISGKTGASGASGADTLTVTFTGDLLLDRGVRRVIEKHGGNPDCLFTPGVDSLFARSQVVVANLECPATKVKAPVFKRFIFRTEPEWLPALRRHGITHLNLANNHAIDQGREGLMDTRRNIIAADMIPVGAGATMDEAVRPVLLSEKPRRVWLCTSVRLMLENFAYLDDHPSVSQEPMDSLLQRVRRQRNDDPSAVIIVSLHWGGEHTLRPVAAQRFDAHRLIDAGADALICHHTHTMQTMETYRDRPIYYSIGNFIFDQRKPENSQASLVSLTITADTVKATTIPIKISNCIPALMPYD